VIKRGSQRLAWDIVVDNDLASIEAGGQFVDIDGNLLAATCASGTATRFEGEQDED
jgi:hypothetical protein